MSKEDENKVKDKYKYLSEEDKNRKRQCEKNSIIICQKEKSKN